METFVVTDKILAQEKHYL